MKRKIAGLDEKLLPMSDDDPNAASMLTRRQVFRLIGNVKAESAETSRRVTRIIIALKDAKASALVLESDDINFLQKEFERNAVGLTGWAQGQMLDLIESAEKAEEKK